RGELRQHLLVRGVHLVVHLDARLLGEIVDDALGNVLGPTEQIDRFGRVRRPACACEHGGRRHGGGESETDVRSHGILLLAHLLLRRRTASAATTASTVAAMKTVEMALSEGSSPFFTRPKI